MSEIQQTRYDHLLRRVAGLIGPGSKVGEAIGDLLPVLDVENTPGELLVLAGTRMGSGHINAVAAALDNQRAQLFNPADSGALVTVTRVSIASNTAQLIRIGPTFTALTTNNNTRAFSDTRLPTGPVTLAQLRNDGDPASSPVGGFLVFIQSLVPFTMESEKGLYVLAPGTGLQVSTTSINTTLTVAYMWRERPAEQSELQF